QKRLFTGEALGKHYQVPQVTHGKSYAAIRPSALYPPSPVFSLSTTKSNKPPANPDVVFRTQPLILLAALVHFLALPKGICTGSRLTRNPRGLKLSSGLANLSRKSARPARAAHGTPPAILPEAKVRVLPTEEQL